MAEQEVHAGCDLQESRIEQARALLDLFEGDHRRPAATMEELKEWACAQDDEYLRFRVKRHLALIINGRFSNV
jgi:hypothetical protein